MKSSAFRVLIVDDERDIRELVEEDLFQLFLKRLNKSPFDARDRRDILTLALQAFTESR